MTKGEAIAGALRWIDEATVGGQVADNDELADLRDRMATLLDGVLQLLGRQFPQEGVFSVQAQGGWQEITLPTDCVLPRDIVLVQGTARMVWPPRRWIGSKKVWVLGDSSGTFQIYYERRPAHLAVNALDSAVLDCATDAESLIPLKLAADALSGLSEKAALGAFLEDKFAAMLKNLLPPERSDEIRSIYEVIPCM